MIYIKDMDMPVDCMECRCRIGCIYATSLVIGRPADCPLEEAKTGDLIRRADAIEAVRKELVCDGRHETHDKTCRFIADVLLSALPSAEAVHKPDYSYEADMVKRLRAVQEAQATQGWIPCSERLPDVGEIVIASWSDLWSDAIVFARRYCEDDWEWAYEQGSDYWESARDYDRESNPEAWMPLPEPYEPKTERRG